MHRQRLITLTVLLTFSALSACGGPATSATPTPATQRPSSPVKVTIVSPTNGEVVHGNSVNLVVTISGGEIVKTTSTHITPTQGHVHVYLNGQLIYMQYSLTQTVAVQPGLTYSMRAEYVASDHAPFFPRDFTPTIVFTVASS